MQFFDVLVVVSLIIFAFAPASSGATGGWTPPFLAGIAGSHHPGPIMHDGTQLSRPNQPSPPASSLPINMNSIGGSGSASSGSSPSSDNDKNVNGGNGMFGRTIGAPWQARAARLKRFDDSMIVNALGSTFISGSRNVYPSSSPSSDIRARSYRFGSAMAQPSIPGEEHDDMVSAVPAGYLKKLKLFKAYRNDRRPMSDMFLEDLLKDTVQILRKLQHQMNTYAQPGLSENYDARMSVYSSRILSSYFNVSLEYCSVMEYAYSRASFTYIQPSNEDIHVNYTLIQQMQLRSTADEVFDFLMNSELVSTQLYHSNGDKVAAALAGLLDAYDLYFFGSPSSDTQPLNKGKRIWSHSMFDPSANSENVSDSTGTSFTIDIGASEELKKYQMDRLRLYILEKLQNLYINPSIRTQQHNIIVLNRIIVSTMVQLKNTESLELYLDLMENVMDYMVAARLQTEFEMLISEMQEQHVSLRHLQHRQQKKMELTAWVINYDVNVHRPRFIKPLRDQTRQLPTF